MLFPDSTFRRTALAMVTAVAAAVAMSGLVASPAAAHSRAALAAVDGVATEPIGCPVAVDSQFDDSWGDARSGGRRHEGVDMAAPRGSAVIAAAAGFAEFTTSGAGGNAIWLTTPNGDKFYYAHLDDWEGSSRLVRGGDVVGYVGSTGNARGDHLHFEVRPGGVAVNPYPFVEQACSPAPIGVGSRMWS